MLTTFLLLLLWLQVALASGPGIGLSIGPHIAIDSIVTIHWHHTPEPPFSLRMRKGADQDPIIGQAFVITDPSQGSYPLNFSRQGGSFGDFDPSASDAYHIEAFRDVNNSIDNTSPFDFTGLDNSPNATNATTSSDAPTGASILPLPISTLTSDDSGTSTSAATSPTTSSSDPANPLADSSSNPQHSSKTLGIIIGSVVPAVLILALIIVCCVRFYRRRGRNQRSPTPQIEFHREMMIRPRTPYLSTPSDIMMGKKDLESGDLNDDLSSTGSSTTLPGVIVPDQVSVPGHREPVTIAAPSLNPFSLPGHEATISNEAMTTFNTGVQPPMTPISPRSRNNPFRPKPCDAAGFGL
ncbi:hypothetical protein C8J56DRAFT_921889 [Mycena floridula]|nr:hypothetical protein C8J56DRAFT_921889 [Mycena floridula]